MGAKTSPQMLLARQLILAGASQYAAASQAGVTRGAISKSKWWKNYIATKDHKK